MGSNLIWTFINFSLKTFLPQENIIKYEHKTHIKAKTKCEGMVK